jgi:hypothetical protein
MEEKLTLKLQVSQSPTMFTDAINIAKRVDGSIYMQAVSGTPDRIIENFRTMMTNEGATNFLDNLAKALDYYPVKKQKPIIKEKTSKTTTSNK